MVTLTGTLRQKLESRFSRMEASVSRAGIGNMAILQRLAATNQGFQSLVCHDDIDPYFVFSMGDSIKTKA